MLVTFSMPKTNKSLQKASSNAIRHFSWRFEARVTPSNSLFYYSLLIKLSKIFEPINLFFYYSNYIIFSIQQNLLFL